MEIPMETIDHAASCVEWANVFVLAATAMGAAVFARWRCNTADANLRIGTFKSACELWSTTKTEGGTFAYMSRIGCVTQLAQLAKTDPENYHITAMRMFEAYIGSPSMYFGTKTVDPDSRETVEVIDAVERRDKEFERKKGYEFSVPFYSPFYMDACGTIRLKKESLIQVRQFCTSRGITSRFVEERHST